MSKPVLQTQQQMIPPGNISVEKDQKQSILAGVVPSLYRIFCTEGVLEIKYSTSSMHNAYDAQRTLNAGQSLDISVSSYSYQPHRHTEYLRNDGYVVITGISEGLNLGRYYLISVG